MRPTFPFLFIALLLSLLLSFILFKLQYFVLFYFPLLFIYTFFHFQSISVPPVCTFCLSITNPVTIYRCLLPLAKARTNAISVGGNLAFCDKPRLMRSVFFFKITSKDPQMIIGELSYGINSSQKWQLLPIPPELLLDLEATV